MKREYHFIKEIREQPERLRETLLELDPQIKKIAEKYHDKVDRIIMTGCGDPYLLGLGAVYAFENWAKIPAASIEAAELSMYRNDLINEKSLVILISSSGKTIKVIDSAAAAKKANAPNFALVNLAPSSLTEQVDEYLQTKAGWSDSFPTKQTTTALAVLLALALHWAAFSGMLSKEKIDLFRDELYNGVPEMMGKCLELEEEIRKLSEEHLDAPIYTFIGSGPNLCTALLSAAKMKETSQSRSEACNLEEYAHLYGLSLKPNDPVFLLTYPSNIGKAGYDLSKRILVNEGRLIVVGPESEYHNWQNVKCRYFSVPDHTEIFAPLISWIPLQLFAYFTSINKGRNPDKPIDHKDILEESYDIYTSPLEGWDER